MYKTFTDKERYDWRKERFTKEETAEYFHDMNMFNSLCMKSSVFKSDSCNEDYTVKFVQSATDLYVRTEAFLYCGDETLCWLNIPEVDWLHDKGIHVDGYNEHNIGFVFDMT